MVCERTHLSQHMLVKVCIDCCRRACACSRSRKLWSSFCRIQKASLAVEHDKNEKTLLLGWRRQNGQPWGLTLQVEGIADWALGQNLNPSPSFGPSVFSGYGRLT